MPDPLDNAAPFDDEQGTKIARKPVGAGSEPTQGTHGEPDTNSQDDRSGYGGKGGEPVKPNDIPTSRR